MRIRCPHCHNPIELVEESSFRDLTCPSCGSGFSLVSAETGSYEPAKPRTLGHFELIQRLGTGAFGTVWKAHDTHLDRTVAVKIPRNGQLDEVEAELFLREARAAAQLRHPHIVAVHEVGRDDGEIYIVSDYVPGVTLADWLTAHRLTPRESAELCATISDALDHAHEAGVVHRDLKPSNIMLDDDSQPHLMDFGLAKRDAGEITMTLEGRLVGTPAYMSPEQARGEAHQADRRSDVYSLGVILFELLTSERPFRGNARMLLQQVMNDEPPSPRSLNGNVPRDLETICLKCLQKEPASRYSTAADVAHELRRFLGGQAILARPISRVARTWRWCRRNPVVAGLLTTASAMLAVVAAVSSLAYWHESQMRVREAELRSQVQTERNIAIAAGAGAIRQRNAAQHSLYTAHIVLAQQAWEASDVKQVQKLLDQHLPKPDLLDQRGWEWHYLRSLCHQELRTLAGHKDSIANLAWSPDGKRIATAGYDHQLGIWDVGTGEAIVLQRAGDNRIVSIAWNPHHELIATGGMDGLVKLWNPATGDEIMSQDEHEGVVDVSWNPGGDRLASAGDDAKLRIWDTQGMLVATHTLAGKARAISWSADGERLAVAVDQKPVQILSTVSGEGLSTLPDPASSVAWSPDGEKIVTVHGPSGLTVWKAMDGTKLFSLKAQNDNPTVPSTINVTWSPDSQQLSLARATIGEGGGIAVLDVASQRQTRSFRTGGVFQAVWSPDGKLLASAGKDGLVKLWDATRDQTSAEFTSERGKHESLAWSTDGKHLASGGWWLGSEPLTVWEMQNPSGRLAAILHRDEQIFCASWEPHGQRLAFGSDADVTIFDPASPDQSLTLKEHTAQVNAVVWKPDGSALASASHDHSIKIWDPQSGTAMRSLKGHTDSVLTLDWHPNGMQIASSGQDHEIKIWDTEIGTETASLPGHPGNTTMVVRWSPDGARLASCAGTEVRIWDVATKQQQFELTGHFALVTCLAWHPSGERLVTCGFDQTVKLWDTDSGQLLLTLRPREHFARAIAWSPDGRRLAAATFARITLWDGTSSAELK